MVDDDRYCVDLLHHLSAVQGALNRIRRDILEGRLRGCLATAVAEGNADELLDELVTAAFRTVPTSRSPHDRCRPEDGGCAHAS
jgi:DNA-binding FrmR family transcriptional regulator